MLDHQIVVIKRELAIWFPYCSFSVRRDKNASYRFHVILDVSPIPSSDFTHNQPFCNKWLAGSQAYLDYHSDDSKLLFKGFRRFIQRFNTKYATADSNNYNNIISFKFTKHYTQEEVSDWKSQLARTLLINV